MTNIEIVRTLINAMDTSSVQDEAIKQAVLALLDQEPKKSGNKEDRTQEEVHRHGQSQSVPTGRMELRKDRRRTWSLGDDDPQASERSRGRVKPTDRNLWA